MISWVICRLGLTDSVLSDHDRPFLGILPVIERFVRGKTCISEDQSVDPPTRIFLLANFD
jgi:hypothetical protein